MLKYLGLDYLSDTPIVSGGGRSAPSVDTLDRVLPRFEMSLTLESDRVSATRSVSKTTAALAQKQPPATGKNRSAGAAFLRISPEQHAPIARPTNLFLRLEDAMGAITTDDQENLCQNSVRRRIRTTRFTRFEHALAFRPGQLNRRAPARHVAGDPQGAVTQL